MSAFAVPDSLIIETLIAHLERQSASKELADQCLRLLRLSTSHRVRLSGGGSIQILGGAASHHEAVRVEYLGQQVPIDRALVPLMTKLWSVGCRTEYSCEGERGGGLAHTAYIAFSNTESFTLFLRILESGGCAHLTE